MSTSLDDIEETFELLGDWDQRYAYLIELGEKLPELDAKYRIEENKVKGCMSQVWVKAVKDRENSALINFQGDCDTSIIKGVLALLIEWCSKRTADQIGSINVEEFFSRLKLDEHLSPNRHFGIYAIIELMKQQAAHLK